jgi:hypothetical protein
MAEDLDKTSKENVIKALEGCTADIAKYALAVIKRLDAENKRLKRYDEERDIALHARLIDEARAETMREMHAKGYREVVQCKDCVYWEEESKEAVGEKWGYCSKPMGDYRHSDTAENDYCSYGKGKEQNNDGE